MTTAADLLPSRAPLDFLLFDWLWSAEDKALIVAEICSGLESVRAVARRYGLPRLEIDLRSAFA